MADPAAAPGEDTPVGDRGKRHRAPAAQTADNVRAGVLFLDELYALTGGDVRMTLAGYFQGLANVRRNGMFNATERYIDNVLALRERFR